MEDELIELQQSWRMRFLWEVMRLGAIIGGAQMTIDGYYGENVSATIEYGWWYRPIVRFASWILGHE